MNRGIEIFFLFVIKLKEIRYLWWWSTFLLYEGTKGRRISGGPRPILRKKRD